MSARPGPWPAIQALQAAGLTVDEAARRARYSRRYLLQLARDGAPFDTAERLAFLLPEVGMEVWRRPPGREPRSARSARQLSTHASGRRVPAGARQGRGAAGRGGSPRRTR